MHFSRVTGDDDQFLPLRNEASQSDVRVLAFEIFDEAVVRLYSENALDRPAPQIEIHQISLEARIAAHRRGEIRRHERLAHAWRCRNDPEHPPALFTAKRHQLRADEIEAARAGVAAVKAVNEIPPRGRGV